jgi:starch synthase (maltosyl-transferring)
MQSLAQVGFQQSYTYFTWRNTKVELEEYLTELSHETSDYLRPNLFVNTHDILPPYLQFGGVPAYKIRAAIAATASPTWGVYSGYELIENVARPGAEENIDNEKYEYKPRDFAKAETLGRSIAPYLTMLNTIRAEHPALRQLRNLEVHWSDDDSILVYSKYLDGRFTRSGKRDGIIVVANVDPHSVRASSVYLDPTKFGIDPSQPFEVTDLITKQRYTWGLANFVRLDAFTEPVHILRVDYPKGI